MDPHLNTYVPMENGLALFDVARGTYFHLNEVASAIWQALETSRTLGSICDDLINAYDVSPETCERDVRTFIMLMHEKGVFELTNQ